MFYEGFFYFSQERQGEKMSQQEEIIIRELDKNPDISITDLEGMTELPIGEVCKIRYFWRLEKKREGKRYGTCQVIGKIKDTFRKRRLHP
ncbi:MAG: hypothetical protein MZV70_25315 [Desulfobacterales bacterium]|nr:hypothetical protein [Desulfobacterales bacterium]